MSNGGSTFGEKGLRDGDWELWPQRCHVCEWVGYPDTPQTCDRCASQKCLSVVLPKKVCQSCGWYGHPEYLQECPQCGSVDKLIQPEEGTARKS